MISVRRWLYRRVWRLERRLYQRWDMEVAGYE